MEWQPLEEPLRQLAGYLKDSLSGHDQNAQKHATLMLSQAESSPDINNYLTYLVVNTQPPSTLTFNPEEFHAIRCAAAVMLKNDIKNSYKRIPASSLSYIRSSIFLGLEDPNSQIRNYVGNVITEIVRQGGILGWQELLPGLFSLVSNEGSNVSPGAQEGAMGALAKVCEDNKQGLDRDYNGQRPLNFIIPRLLEFTSSPIAKVRAYALASLNVFIPQKSQALLLSLDALLARLFLLANDSSNDVRRNVCRAFVHLVDIRPDKIAPHMEGLVDYMVSQQRKTDDPELALDAAEFWLCVGEHENLRAALGPFLPKIIPVLLESMVYSEEEIMMLEGGEDDADEEDRVEDIKPNFAKSKSSRAVTTANGETSIEDSDVVLDPGANGSSGRYAKITDEDDDLSEGEIEEYDDADDGADPEDRWTLRKCSAAALDVLASVFHGPVFEITLPYLKDNLRHAEWPYREAAVLALGAVADGCLHVVTPHLPDLVLYLVSLLNDPEPLVRQITCWTLGRYSLWASHLTDPADRARYFEPMMEGILTKMLDNNKRVQEAGASAFANLEEQGKSRLTPYAEPIVRQFVRCFGKYKDRNMFILYDCVQTLAEHVGQGLARPDLVGILMPALIHRWNKVSDKSRELFPLLECLSYVATALGSTFSPFAGPIFSRCVRIIHQNLEEYLAAVNNAALDSPDKDFLVTSLDLLSAVIQALEPEKSADLLAASQPNFFELLTFCMEDPSNDVRQSSYALLGDCAIYVFAQLQPFLPTLLPILSEQLNLDKIPSKQMDTGFSVVNNACWSCGEIAMRHGKAMAPFVDTIVQRLTDIITSPNVPTSLTENAAIALGRLGMGSFQELAPHLGNFAEQFLDAAEKVDFTDEKATAFEGFTMVVGQNPHAMEKCLAKFFKAIAGYKGTLVSNSRTRDILIPLFHQILTGYKSLIPDFNAFLNQLPADDQRVLRSTYNL
ncbi:MAG: hypothetical protein M1813_003879 [Trichoglossum hirsutum]|nr:MAG: hypothetical protein M1813_003879 [Trichoglossum hirsutum]